MDTHKRTRLTVGVAAVLLTATACGRDAAEVVPPDLIDRETFVATYVDLRATAIRSEDGVLDDEERAEVLARHEVTEEELLDFARYHGRDVEQMRNVWDEIEDRLDEEPIGGPSAEG